MTTKRRRAKFTGRLATDADFQRWARHAVAGVDESGSMLGIINGAAEPYRWEFALQVGHCLLEGKPLILVVADDVPLPDKLAAAATVVERYRRGDLLQMEAATKRALEQVGLPVRQ